MSRSSGGRFTSDPGVGEEDIDVAFFPLDNLV
jgi:hypothetical protein